MVCWQPNPKGLTLTLTEPRCIDVVVRFLDWGVLMLTLALVHFLGCFEIVPFGAIDAWRHYLQAIWQRAVAFMQTWHGEIPILIFEYWQNRGSGNLPLHETSFDLTTYLNAG